MNLFDLLKEGGVIMIPLALLLAPAGTCTVRVPRVALLRRPEILLLSQEAA